MALSFCVEKISFKILGHTLYKDKLAINLFKILTAIFNSSNPWTIAL